MQQIVGKINQVLYHIYHLPIMIDIKYVKGYSTKLEGQNQDSIKQTSDWAN